MTTGVKLSVHCWTPFPQPGPVSSRCPRSFLSHPRSLVRHRGGGTNLTAADFNSYHFRDVWGGDHEESVQKVHSFFDSEHFRQMPTVPGALEALTALKESFSLVIVTSRQHVIEEETRQWVDRHFNVRLAPAQILPGARGRSRHLSTACPSCTAGRVSSGNRLAAVMQLERGAGSNRHTPRYLTTTRACRAGLVRPRAVWQSLGPDGREALETRHVQGNQRSCPSRRQHNICHAVLR